MSLKPISLNEFEKRLNKVCRFEIKPSIAVALSGGPDSMALTCLLNDWVNRKGGSLVSIIVDHNVRSESAKECKRISYWMEKKNINFKLLKLKKINLKTNIMEYTRKKRYEVILNECSKLKILHLFLGHHLNDKIETYLMRSKRFGNIIGLSSIPKIRELKSTRLIRPLLDISKERLIKTCEFYQQPWVQDPSNNNLKFERARVRLFLQKKNMKFIKSKTKTIDNFVNKRDKYEGMISMFLLANLKFYKFGVFEIKKTNFLKLTNEIQIETMKRILTTCSGKVYPPKKESVKKIILDIFKSNKSTLTLHSCLINSKLESITICREPIKTKITMKKELIVKKGSNALWDNRFRVISKNKDIKCELITEKNWKIIKKQYFDNNEIKGRCLPFYILKTLPLISFDKHCLIPFETNKELTDRFGLNVFFEPINGLTGNYF